MKNLFSNVNKNVFKSKQSIVWFDKEGIFQIDDNRYVSIKLDDVGTQNSFNGYQVKMFNRNLGEIKSRFFRFNDYMNINHIWLYSGNLDWYTVFNGNSVSKPTEKDLKEFVNIIFEYIEMIK